MYGKDIQDGLSRNFPDVSLPNEVKYEGKEKKKEATDNFANQRSSLADATFAGDPEVDFRTS